MPKKKLSPCTNLTSKSNSSRSAVFKVKQIEQDQKSGKQLDGIIFLISDQYIIISYAA